MTRTKFAFGGTVYALSFALFLIPAMSTTMSTGMVLFLSVFVAPTLVIVTSLILFKRS
jgi:hypothetical protein